MMIETFIKNPNFTGIVITIETEYGIIFSEIERTEENRGLGRC